MITQSEVHVRLVAEEVVIPCIYATFLAEINLDNSLMSNYCSSMKNDQIIFLIGRIQYKASRFLTRELRVHDIKGLATSHGEILGALMFQGPLSMTEIARIIDKDKSTITALVDKLIRLGYVKKEKHGADNRFSLIAVTQKGEALKPAFVSIARKLRALSYKDIPDDERETLVRLLTKLNENL